MRRFEVLLRRAWDRCGRDSVPPRFNFEVEEEEDGFFVVLEEDREIERGFEGGFEDILFFYFFRPGSR